MEVTENFPLSIFLRERHLTKTQFSIRTGASTRHLFAETTFPPFGFVLAVGSPPPDKRLTDITYFADDFRHDETRTLWLRLPVLPVYTIYPGDYRSRDKVLTDAGRKPQ